MYIDIDYPFEEAGRMISWKRIGDKVIRYLKNGRGEPLVLIHGLGSSMTSWTKNIDPLSKHFTVYALDLPGHGYSSPLGKGEANLDFSSEFLEEFFDKIGLDQFTCVGASLGGLISMRYILNYPGRVKKLVLINSAGLGRGIAWLFRIMSLPFVGKRISISEPASAEMALEKLVFNKKSIPKGMAEELARMRSAEDRQKNMLELLRYGVSIRGQRKHIILLKYLPDIKIPTLLLWGENDKIFPVKQAHRAVKLFPNATLRVFPETGHLLPIERPKELKEEIVEFVLGKKNGGGKKKK